MRVRDLKPGDESYPPKQIGLPKVLVVKSINLESPCYPTKPLACVIWITEAGLEWSHDHLSPDQDIGEIVRR